MAFESLSDKLQNIFKNLRGKGRLSEADVKAALKEVKMALLEADVSFKVVKQFISSVQERAVGQDVLNSLTPGQMVVKIVHEELVSLMGSETTEIALKPANEITVILMAGLQGAGKTTTTAKIAGKLKAKGRRPLLAACDVYRPAAIKQLQINGEKQGVPVFAMGENQSPVDIAKAAVEHAAKNGFNVVILDTAGRLHIDEGMMEELAGHKDSGGRESDPSDCRRHDRTGRGECGGNLPEQDRHRRRDPYQNGWRHPRRSRAFHKSGHRPAHSVCGHGRKAFRSGAVLSGPHGVPDSGHGRYPFSD